MFKACRARPALSAIGALSVLAVAACAPQRVETTSSGEVVRVTNRAIDVVSGWPGSQRESATQLIARYGEPSVVGERMLAWFNTGPFVKTVLMRDGQAHNWPTPHVDYLTQTVKHGVPAGRLDDLYEYDGSVWFHRTRGELSAQCDKVEMNYLALNLAHDIITGKRTVSDARNFYAKTAKAFKDGDKSSAYVSGLIFQTEPNAADPDRPHPM